MRKIFQIIFLLPIIFTSCQYFEKAPVKEELLNNEIKAIDWTTVDEFPSISSCDSIADKTEKQRCFFDCLSVLIQEKLSVDTPSVSNAKGDSINLKITVLPDAQLQFETVIQNQDSLSNLPKIDSIIKLRLIDFPKINPAIKRGIPVKTQFILPVILKVE